MDVNVVFFFYLLCTPTNDSGCNSVKYRHENNNRIQTGRRRVQQRFCRMYIGNSLMPQLISTEATVKRKSDDSKQ